MKLACISFAVTLLIWVLTPTSSLLAQVVINEFMAANRSVTADEDGHYSDWIELLNLGSTSVNLEGYGLSDDPGSPFKWTFPPIAIPPGGFLTVWASGKNRNGLIPQPGILREVYLGIPGGSVESLEAAGTFPSFPDVVQIMSNRLNVPRDFGDNYGQRLSGFLIPAASGNYDFSISADNGSRVFLSPDDDPANARAIAEVPADRWSDPDTYNTFSTQQSVAIPLAAGRMYYMEVLMKEDVGGDHLSVRWRRNGSNSTREVIPASNFIVKPSTLHTNFSISAAGEPLLLTQPDGTVVSEMPAVPVPVDHSFGRMMAQPEMLRFFASPTRGSLNSTTGFSEILEDSPNFSVPGGMYDSGFPLSLTATGPNTKVIYTLDGSIPKLEHLGNGGTFQYRNQYPNGPALESIHQTYEYTQPIDIRDRSGEPNKLATRASTYSGSSSYIPASAVFKGTVVRARVVREGALPGPVITQTYFVAPGMTKRYQLPVISLAMDEEALFGYENGLYTAGTDYDRWRANSTFNGNGGTPANYKRRGEFAEHPANFELFVPDDGRVASKTIGFRMHGGWSRAWPQKSLRIYADSDLGEGGVLDYPLIPGLVGRTTGRSIHSFNRLVLRNSGNDHEHTRVRDAFIHALNRPLDIDRQGFEPAVHFINGEYWGLINIRERIDRFYIASHHGIDPDLVAILSNNAEISEGGSQDRADFIALRDYISTYNMAESSRYAYVAERMDIDNFIRYNVAQIYANNRDWPHNNIDVWRASIPGLPSNVKGASDGRWRWILFDTDFGFGLDGGPETDTLAHATRNAGGEDWSTVMLRELLRNPEFRNCFINTFADHMATSYLPAVVNAVADETQARILPALGEHRARWRNHSNATTAPIKNFGSNRPIYMRQHLMNRFGLPGVATVTLDTPDATRGTVQINSITIGAKTPGVVDPEDPHPWTGSYFRNVPVTVTARPAPGFRFAGWLEIPSMPSPTLTVTPGTIGKLTALFEEGASEALVHYWNFNDADYLSRTSGLVPNGEIIHLPSDGSAMLAGSGQEFSGENARGGDSAGTHLRLNSPIGAKLELLLPTRGYEAIVLQYEARRSGQGAGVQSISYSVNGVDFVEFQSIVVTETPQLHQFDFSDVPGVSDNINFKVRIGFSQGGGGVGGNNRMDNITLDGRPIPGVNRPPIFVGNVDSLAVIENGEALSFDLNDWFEDPDGDGLTYTVQIANPELASGSVEGSMLSLAGLRRGFTEFTLTADDHSGLVEVLKLGVLVYPAAQVIAEEGFRFDSWSSDSPLATYPAHMLFLQSEVSDPGASEPLVRAYDVGDDVHPDDIQGFPYKHSRRTRINGLEEHGISFVNTGRGRDLGGALAAVDTREIGSGVIRFTAETLAAGDREYVMRLQYRVGIEGEFIDLYQNGQPVTYVASEVEGSLRDFENIAIPEDALGREHVQFLWRYHHIAGESGSRPEVRLDDILVLPMTPVPLTGFARWQAEQFPGVSDPEIIGPDVDPFGWGMPNLIRYALTIDSPEGIPLRSPRLGRSIDDESWYFRFPYDVEKFDIYYLVERSSELESWDRIFDSREPEVPEAVDGWLTIPVIEGEGGFFRVKVGLVGSESD